MTDFDTVREAVAYAVVGSLGDFTDALAALDRIEAENERLRRIEEAARKAADLAQREAADALDREQVPFAARAARPLLDVRDALRAALREEK